MPTLQTATYAPLKGYMDSVERDVVPRDRMTLGPSGLGNSYNMVMDPISGATTPRLGTLIEGDDPTTPAGLLESKYGPRARQMFELVSPATTDGLGSPACLLSNENTGEGQIFWRDLQNAANRAMLVDADRSGYYPSNGSGKTYFIMPPLKARHVPATGTQRRDYTRGLDAIQRRIGSAGGRRVMQVGDYLHTGAFHGTPTRWNKVNNLDGTTAVRVKPWGNLPPGWMPNLAQSGSGTGWSTTLPTFAYSVMFRHRDGSYSMPVIPRFGYVTGGVTVPAYGVFTLTHDSDVITWSNVPRGDDTVDARIMLRSPAVASGVSPDLSDLRICGAIFNNVSDSYLDTNYGNSTTAIPADPTKVRLDHVWPWRSRYAWSADERVFIGYLRPNPEALIVSYYKSASGTVQNCADVDGYSVSEYACGVVEDQTGATTATGLLLHEGSGGSEGFYDFATYTSLSFLADAVNTDRVVLGATSAQFRVNIVPGSDRGAATSSLDLTQLRSKADTNGTNVITVNVTGNATRNFNHVRIGMRVTGTDIPAGTYVKSVSASTVNLGDAAGVDVAASGTHTAVVMTFGWETGDASPGLFRSFCGAYPAILAFSESYLDTYTTKKRGIMFTSGEPGHARNAANNFYSTIPILEATADAGLLVGGAHLQNNACLGIACYSKAIYRIENPRAGNTALDADIRLRPINRNRGCIAWDSIVEGDGWVSYLTEDGLVVTDGYNERVISRDVWNVANPALGQLGTEIKYCRQATHGDVEGAYNSTNSAQFHAMVATGRLYCSYRSSGYYQPNTMLVYDFSPGVAAYGLGEVVQGDADKGAANAYGWSAPLNGARTGAGRVNPGCMCTVRRGDGLYHYFWDDGNPGTLDGMMERFNLPSTYTDNGVAYGCAFVSRTDRCETTLKKTAQFLRSVYYKASGTLSVKLFRNSDGTSNATILTYGTAASGSSTVPVRTRRDVPVTLKSPSDVLGLYVSATAAFHFRLYAFELDFEVNRGYQ